MTFDEMQERARALTPAQVNAQLAQLMTDPKFPSVLAWLERNERAWSQTVTSQTLAKDHGKLAHAAGSLHALQILIGQLQGVMKG